MESSVPERLEHPLRVRTARVVRVGRVTPRMVAVRLAGEGLAGLPVHSPDDHVQLYLPAAPGAAPRVPQVVAGRRVGGADLQPREYTVRRFLPEGDGADTGPVLDLELVAHPEGPGGRWAASAAVGDEVGVLGPRTSTVLPGDLDWYLVAGDETAQPALLGWAERLPAGRVTVLAEVCDAADERQVPAGAAWRWLHREGPAGGGAGVLAEAVRAFGRPEGRGYVWVAGEARAVRPLRRHLVRELGLGREEHSVSGYWRAGSASTGAGAV